MAMLRRVLGAWRKRRAIGSYLRRLPKQLRRDYGPSDRYTPAQIRASIARAKLDRTYSCYAEACFTDRDAFAGDHAARGEICDYEAMRTEVSASHFEGHGMSTPGEALAMADAVHGGDAAFGHHGDGGGHGASDAGHGSW